MKNKIQTLKGFRDFLPGEKRKRDYVISKIKEVFDLYGFEPLETPTLEYASLLLGKYGEEADKLVYKFKDRGGREVALKYDQTVPTARILAQYQNQLPKYFRRYQIQNVFRADNPQKGRYREFTQCDIDIFGSSSPLADAEILACTYFAIKNIFPNNVSVKIFINERQSLIELLKPFTNDKVDVYSIIRSLDKLDKLPKDQVKQELEQKGLSEEQVENIFEQTQSTSPPEKIKKIIELAEGLGIPKDIVIQYSNILARGLDYYTGMIFEVTIVKGGSLIYVGSIAGGGRYDNLIKQLGGIDVPAVGVAFGLDRIIEAADQLKLISVKKTDAQVLVITFEETLNECLQIANRLRQSSIKTELYPAIESLDKQLKYADKKGIPYVVIVGKEEVKQNKITLKNMKTREQKLLSIEEAIKTIKS